MVKNPPVNAGDVKDAGLIPGSRTSPGKGNGNSLQYGQRNLDPWVTKIPWERKWQLTIVFFPGESHEQRSLVGYGPQGCKELDTTEAI